MGSETGAALAEARVCAVCAGCDIGASPPGHCNSTNPSGEYSLDVPPGTFLVTASLSGYEVATANAGEPVQVGSGVDVEGMDLRLTSAEPSLTGRVLDATGGPIEGARVQVADIQYSVRPLVELTTDVDGRFAAALRAERVAIRADAPGYAAALLYRRLPSTGATLELVPGSTLEGRVVDATTGSAVADVDVRAAGTIAATLAAPARSDADGHFVLQGLEPGRYVLSAEGDGYGSDAPRAVEVGFGEQVSGLRLAVLPSASVHGHVLIDEANEPCREGYVHLGPLSERSLANRLEGDRATILPDSSVPSVLAQIDHLGRVRLRGLRPGRYFVTLECKDHVYRDGPMVLEVEGQGPIRDLAGWARPGPECFREKRARQARSPRAPFPGISPRSDGAPYHDELARRRKRARQPAWELVPRAMSSG